MNAMMRLVSGLGFAVALTASAARADFELFWFTIDDGGAQAMSGGKFTLDATAGQSDAGVAAADAFDLSGGFWPGVTAGGSDCAGGERIAKARCKDRNGATQLKVVLTGGREGDSFSITLTDGSAQTGTINSRGKGTGKFNNRPAGDAGIASAEWGCGAANEKNYSCP